MRVKDKALRRAGLDYWKEVDCTVWDSLEELVRQMPADRAFFLTTKYGHPYWGERFKEGDWLVFGSETRGLPDRFLESVRANALTIPMNDRTTRSLNLAMSVGIVMFEGLRQLSLGDC